MTFDIYITKYELNLQDIDFKIISENINLLKNLNIFKNKNDLYDLLERIDNHDLNKNDLYKYIKKEYNNINFIEKINILIKYHHK